MMIMIVDIYVCLKCRRENSHNTFKCVECGHLFFTNEELAAKHPPGRGGPQWWKRYHSDGTEKDVADLYLQEVGKTWSPDPECRGLDGWIAPDGTFWPCDLEKHFHIAPVLVAFYDLFGNPQVNEREGLGGRVERDEHDRKYYKESVRYPDSVKILKEKGFILMGRAATRKWESAIYYRRDPNRAQRATLEKWKIINEVGYIHYYDKKRPSVMMKIRPE